MYIFIFLFCTQKFNSSDAAEVRLKPHPEPVFVNLLRSPGIDSQPWRASTTTLFVVPACQATLAGGINFSDSIPWLHKRLLIRALPSIPSPFLSVQKEISIYVVPENELVGLSPHFHIHVSVSDSNIPTMGPPIFLQQNMQTDCGIYKSHTETWM